jgi:hypothetical protein
LKLSLIPLSRHPDGLPKERRTNVAAVRRSTPQKLADGSKPSPAARSTGSFAGRSSAERNPAKTADLSAIRRAFSCVRRLTITGSEDYIHALGRAAARRDGASTKPLTVHTVTDHSAMNAWPCSRRRVGCAGFRFSGKPETEPQGSGCLTGESEERETWTAESLRTAFANGEGYAFSVTEAVMEETLAVDV